MGAQNGWISLEIQLGDPEILAVNRFFHLNGLKTKGFSWLFRVGSLWCAAFRAGRMLSTAILSLSWLYALGEPCSGPYLPVKGRLTAQNQLVLDAGAGLQVVNERQKIYTSPTKV